MGARRLDTNIADTRLTTVLKRYITTQCMMAGFRRGVLWRDTDGRERLVAALARTRSSNAARGATVLALSVDTLVRFARRSCGVTDWIERTVR